MEKKTILTIEFVDGRPVALFEHNGNNNCQLNARYVF